MFKWPFDWLSAEPDTNVTKAFHDAAVASAIAKYDKEYERANRLAGNLLAMSKKVEAAEKALTSIAAMETPAAASIGKRMAALAKAALPGSVGK